MLADLASEVKLPDGKTLIESEDSISSGICAPAVQRFVQKICAVSAGDAAKITEEAILSAWPGDRQQYDAINHVVRSLLAPELHIDKMGLAREHVELIHQNHVATESLIDEKDSNTLRDNLAVNSTAFRNAEEGRARNVTGADLSQG